jgi:cytochrome b
LYWQARSEKHGGARMETVEELPQHELIVLRDIHVSGASNNHAVVLQLICDGMIVGGERLELTANGRRMLVRGSPSLWDTAA